MEKLDFDDLKGIFACIDAEMNQNKEYLVRLDATTGDGDLGLTMCAGYDAIVRQLDGSDERDFGKGLVSAGMTMADFAPSTLGTLLAMGMLRAGKVLLGRTNVKADELGRAGTAAVEEIGASGKAKCGDKTVLDSLIPAVETLNDALKERCRPCGGGEGGQ